MYKMNRTVRLFLKLLALSTLGILLAILRYIVRSPQTLRSILPGESRIYQWTNGNVFYKISGVTDAPACVLIHDPGIGSSSYEMRHLVVQLAQHYRVYTLDLIGFGLSDHPKITYSADTYVSLCYDFLKQAVKQPAVLIASGLSCNYCVTIAARTPELCSRLVLLSPQHLFTIRSQPSWSTRKITYPWTGLFVYSILTFRPVLRLLLARQQQIALQEVPTNELAVISAYAHQPGAQYAALARFTGILQTNTLLELKSLKQPVLILWSAQSMANVQLLNNESYISSNIQVISVNNTGTRMHEEIPTKVLTHILSWSAIPKLTENVVQDTTIEVYCVKCKTRRAVSNAHRVTIKNGRSALEGICPVCGTKVFRFTATAKE